MIVIHQFGEMTGIGEFSPKLAAALAHIGDRLFPTLQSLYSGDWRGCCVATSRLVAAFLNAIDVPAELRSAAVFGAMVENGKPDVKRMMGYAAGPTTSEKWHGHLVVTSGTVLIDPTLNRLHSNMPFPTMIALPLLPISDLRTVEGLPAIAGADLIHGNKLLRMIWADKPNASWKETPDGRVIWERTKAFDRLVSEFLTKQKLQQSTSKAECQ